MDTNLIIIILTIVFWIISAIISHNKKKAAAQRPQNPSAFGNDTYEATKHSTEDVFREAIVREAEPWSYDSQVVDETTRLMPRDVPTEHRMNKLGRDGKTNKHRKHNIEGSTEIEMRSPESGSSNILEDFNLRDAIIYSELLKPKFED